MPAAPTLPGDFLDHYLGLGYYRMQQQLFTCRVLPHDGELFAVHWLRLVTARVAYGPRQRQLLRRNAHFRVVVRPFALRPEYDELYARYYRSVTFDTAPMLESLLLDDDGPSVFDTHIVEVRDGARLVAAGIFDRGHETIAGIVNFHDPAYARHSPGKYLMLLKLEYARQQGLPYYYPGYLAYGYPKFDYKLFACAAATEALDVLTGEWRPFSWAEVAAQSAEILAG